MPRTYSTAEMPGGTDFIASWVPEPASGISVGLQQAGGRSFELAQAGTGEHLALCLHGFPELNFSWRYQIPLLRSLGYRVWAPNLRGYGASFRPRGVHAYRLDQLLEDVAALVDASGASRLTLIGHDWGGALAWAFAIRRIRSVERLVVMNMPHPACFARELQRRRQRRRSWYIAAFQLPGLPEWWLARRDGAAVRAAFRGMAVDKGRFPDEVLDVYARAALRPGALTAMVNWYRAAWPTLRRGRLPETPRLDTPTLMVWGERDTALGLETLEGTDRHVADLTLRRLPGVSHWVQQEAPEAVNAILADWLPRADPAAA